MQMIFVHLFELMFFLTFHELKKNTSFCKQHITDSNENENVKLEFTGYGLNHGQLSEKKNTQLYFAI